MGKFCQPTSLEMPIVEQARGWLAGEARATLGLSHPHLPKLTVCGFL